MGLLLSYIKSGIPLHEVKKLIINTRIVYDDDPSDFSYLSNNSLSDMVMFLDKVIDRDFRQRSLAASGVCSCGCDGSKDISGYEQIAVVESHFDIIDFNSRSYVLGLSRVKCLLFYFTLHNFF
jgi:hypothetical protein